MPRPLEQNEEVEGVNLDCRYRFQGHEVQSPILGLFPKPPRLDFHSCFSLYGWVSWVLERTRGLEGSQIQSLLARPGAWTSNPLDWIFFGNHLPFSAPLSKLAVRKGHHNLILGADIKDWWVFNLCVCVCVGGRHNNEIWFLTAINWEGAGFGGHVNLFSASLRLAPHAFLLHHYFPPLLLLFK